MSVTYSIQKIDKELDSLRQSINELESRKEAVTSMSAEHRVACIIHESTCHLDHIEYCGWYYEIDNGIHDWSNGYAHKKYLEKAVKLLEIDGVNEKNIVDILEAL